jgi:hypothetical protein
MLREEIKAGMFISINIWTMHVFFRIIKVEADKTGVRYLAEEIVPNEAKVKTTYLNNEVWSHDLANAKEIDSKLFYKLKKTIDVYHTTINTILNQQ